jgi:hypothetical protein
VQAFLTNRNTSDNNLCFEYSYINPEESICCRAQSTINILTDFYRSKITLEGSNEAESKDIVNYVASINVKTFLKRKNKLFHVCVMKPLNDLNIDTLGELIQEYEFNQVALTERMKIVLGAIPSNLKSILENINENTNCNESLKYLHIANNRKEISMVTTREFQIALKEALKKIDEPNFIIKLGLNNAFDTSNIVETRRMCKNIKLRSIFFRLIHNDFFTKVRMKKLKMIDSDECMRCGAPETTRHLLWECFQASKVWEAFNILLSHIGCSNDCVDSYEKIYQHAASSAITTIKLRVIQALIQIDRPTNWNKEKAINIAIEIINIEKYNYKVNNQTDKYMAKWNTIEAKIYKYNAMNV